MTRMELLNYGLNIDFVNWLEANFSEDFYNQYSICTINRMHLAFLGGKAYGYSEGRHDGFREGYGEGGADGRFLEQMGI